MARLDAPGTIDFTAAAAGHELFAAAVPGAGASGSFAADLSRGGSNRIEFRELRQRGSERGCQHVHRNRGQRGHLPAAADRLRVSARLQRAPRHGHAERRHQRHPRSARKPRRDVGCRARSTCWYSAWPTRTETASTALNCARPPAPAARSSRARAAWERLSARFQFSVNSAGRFQVIADDLEFPDALRRSRRGRDARAGRHRQLFRRRLVHFFGDARQLLHQFHRAPRCAERRGGHVPRASGHSAQPADGHADGQPCACGSRRHDESAMGVDQCHAMHGFRRLVRNQGGHWQLKPRRRCRRSRPSTSSAQGPVEAPAPSWWSP